MDTEMRWGGLAGFGAVIFAAIGRALLGSAPRATDPGPAIAVYLVGHRTQIMMASLLYAAAIVLAVWVGVTLAAVFRRAGETGVLPMLVLAGIVLVGAVGLFAMLVFAGVTYAMTTHPPLLALAAGPYTALTVAGMIAGVASPLPLVATALAIWRTHVFPMWLAWLACLVAAVRVLVAFVVAADVVTPGDTLVNSLVGVLAAVWLLAVSWLLIRGHQAVVTPASTM